MRGKISGRGDRRSFSKIIRAARRMRRGGHATDDVVIGKSWPPMRSAMIDLVHENSWKASERWSSILTSGMCAQETGEQNRRHRDFADRVGAARLTWTRQRVDLRLLLGRMPRSEVSPRASPSIERPVSSDATRSAAG